MPKKLTLNDFIDKANKIHNFKYGYELVEYVNCSTKIIIICPDHGKFEQTPDAHIYGKGGCPKCAILSRALKRIKGIDQFICEANQVHDNKYGYLNSKYVNSQTNIIITCYTHGDFLQIPNTHLQGGGCFQCAHDRIGKLNSWSLDDFLTEANKIHGNLFDYIYVDYKSYNVKVKIKCNTCNFIFEQTPGSHLHGCGCPKCAGRNKTTEQWIEEARVVHGDMYGYLNSKYVSAHTLISITCKTHNEDFLQTPANHVGNKRGCPKCVGRNKTTEEFIAEANNIHLGLYGYGLVDYVNCSTKIDIICKHHGVFSQTPSDHLSGRGCPRCKHTISKSELEFLNYYEIPNDKDHRQLKIKVQIGTKTKYCKPDGYDDKTNTIYEFLGDYWHGNLSKYASDKIHPIREITYGQLYEETIRRFNLLKSLGYNIKYIWETDWDNFKSGNDKFPNIIPF